MTALSPMEVLLETLTLEPIADDVFKGQSINPGWQRVFGGQVVAQALVAANMTVEEDRFCHSLHSYFLRPGDPTGPIDYAVDRIRDGQSFGTRRVVAHQHGQAIFSLAASYHRDEAGLEHHIPMPEGVPMPENLMDGAELIAQAGDTMPESVRHYWQRARPVAFKPTSLAHFISKEKLAPLQNIWMKTTGPTPANRNLRSAVLAYISDMTLLDSALYAHGESIFSPNILPASLDHAMWFHTSNDLDDWLLYAQDSPWSGGGRGLSRGGIYTRSGQLIASVAQEGLIRVKRKVK